MAFSHALVLIFLCPIQVMCFRAGSKAKAQLGCWDSDYNPVACKPHDCCQKGKGKTCDRCPHGEEMHLKCFFSGYRCKAAPPKPTDPPPPKECPGFDIAVDGDVVRVETTLAGKTWVTEGPLGYEVTEGKCVQVGNDGKWYPKPEVRKVEGWCAGLAAEEEGDASVAEAKINQAVLIRCKAPFLPKVNVTTCQASRKFDPEPSCYGQTKDHCDAYHPLVPAEEPGLPRAVRASVGETATVECTSGFEPVSDVECKKRTDYDTYFDPKPSCLKISDWCLSRNYRSSPGSPKVPEASLGQTVTPECAEGFAATSEVVCNSRGTFDPRPSCDEA